MQRLRPKSADELAKAERKAAASGKAERVFKAFQYQTRTSWSKSRRVVARAEHLAKGANPRFIVTWTPPKT
jgi:hypothetical protein